MSLGCEMCGRAPEREEPEDAEEEEQEEQLRRELNNCGDEITNPSRGWWWAPKQRFCPYRTISPEAWECVRIAQVYRHMGLLPYRGQLKDQPAWVFDLLELFEVTSAQMTEEVIERERKQPPAPAAPRRT